MTMLYHNRQFLYEPHWRDQKHANTRMRMHRAVKNRIGIIYEHYRPANYFFAVMDLLRRMFLCGVLVLFNEVYVNSAASVTLSLLQIYPWHILLFSLELECRLLASLCCLM